MYNIHIHNVEYVMSSDNNEDNPSSFCILHWSPASITLLTQYVAPLTTFAPNHSNVVIPITVVQITFQACLDVTFIADDFFTFLANL